MAQAPTRDFIENHSKIGLGWITNSNKDQSFTWHNGGTGGFRSFAGFDRKNQKAIILLGNSIYPLDDIGEAFLTGNVSELLAKSQSEYLVAPEKLQKLVGEYPLMPNFVLRVTHDGKRLYIQATGQDKLPVYAKSDSHFFYKVVKAEVIFELDDKGYAKSLTLHQAGQKLKGVKQL